MSKIMDRVLNFMGFNEEQEEVLEELEEVKTDRPKKGNLFSLPGPKQMRVVVLEPTSYDDARSIADHLKNRRPVILNLEHASHDEAKRIVDFISGATYALSGSMQKIGNHIFLFVPSNVDIDAEIKGNEREKGIFTWVR